MNINKLKGKIVENGMNIESLASAIGMDRSTLYRRFQNQLGESFTIKEASDISVALSLDSKEVMSIFFEEFVA